MAARFKPTPSDVASALPILITQRLALAIVAARLVLLLFTAYPFRFFCIVLGAAWFLFGHMRGNRVNQFIAT